MRPLQAHCNRQRSTKRLVALFRKAGRENIDRPEVTPVVKAPQRLSAATNALIVADYQAGSTTDEIAARYETTAWTVRHRLHRAGVALRPNTTSQEQIDEARVLRADGLSYERIARLVGFSPTTIRMVLR